MKLIWLNIYVKWNCNYTGYSVQAAPKLYPFSHRSKKYNSCNSFPYHRVLNIIKYNSAFIIYCCSFNFGLFCWATSNNRPEVNIKWFYEWIASSGLSAHAVQVEKHWQCMPKFRCLNLDMDTFLLIWESYNLCNVCPNQYNCVENN